MAGILSLLGLDPKGEGILGGVVDTLRSNSNAMLGYGQGGFDGLLQGRRMDLAGQELKEKKAEREIEKKTAQLYAERLGMPELANDPATARALFIDRNKTREPTSDIREYEYARNNGFTGSFADWQTKKANGAGGAFGLNPVYGVDAGGNPIIMQLSKDGKASQTALPEGVKLSKEPIKLDAGTHFVLLDPISRQQVGVIPKNVATVEEQKVLGKASGEAKVEAPAAIGSAEQALKTIEQIRNHPGRPGATGMMGWSPGMPGTPARDFVSLVDQAKGRAFLQAFESLKGGGQITEMEGQKATDAIARLDRAQSKEGFDQALNDLESIIRSGMARSRQRGGMPAEQQAAPQQPQRRRYNPQTGGFE